MTKEDEFSSSRCLAKQLEWAGMGWRKCLIVTNLDLSAILINNDCDLSLYKLLYPLTFLTPYIENKAGVNYNL